MLCYATVKWYTSRSQHRQANELGAHDANGKQFKIFVVPACDESFSTFCFQLIGQGGSFAQQETVLDLTTRRQLKAFNLVTLFMSQSLLLQLL
jgi:hypothetical protein